jgi:hypothetical protein
MDNPPDKRQRGDGKFYTPPCFLMQFQDGDLFFVMEDIEQVVEQIDSIYLEYQGYRVRFSEVQQGMK